MDDSGENGGGWITALLIGFCIAYFFFPKKYEGHTAEYWFNAYDSQTGDTDDKVACLEEIENESDGLYYEEYEELETRLSRINSIALNCQ